LEYHVKEKKPEVRPTADPEKAKADPVVQNKGKGPMMFGKSAFSPVQKPIMANDHEVGSNKTKAADKYHQPRWCPEGLTHSQKRKLQRLRNKDKREQEAKKMRDKHFIKYRPMIPQGKVCQVKTVDQPAAGPVGPTPKTPTGQTALCNRSDWSSPVQIPQPNQQCLFRLLMLMKRHWFL